MNAWEIGMVALAGQLIAILATLYPATAAARMRPVEGLH
jgi:ABC-type lipoprotein release transport system permease subunit